jgi:hypothetical protein
MGVALKLHKSKLTNIKYKKEKLSIHFNVDMKFLAGLGITIYYKIESKFKHINVWEPRINSLTRGIQRHSLRLHLRLTYTGM